MKKPKVSPDFTVEDIHNIREYHYELTRDMTPEERVEFYSEGAREFTEYLSSRKRSSVAVAIST